MFIELQRDARLEIIHYRSLVISIMKEGQPRVEVLEAMLAAYRNALSAYPAGISIMTSIRAIPGVPALSEDFRKKAAELAIATRDLTVGAAIVFGGGGLQATLVRSMLSFTQLLSKARHPQKIFGEDAEAIKWLCALPNQLPALRDNADALVEAYQARLQPLAPKSSKT
jgi:hypothetical protein